MRFSFHPGSHSRSVTLVAGCALIAAALLQAEQERGLLGNTGWGVWVLARLFYDTGVGVLLILQPRRRTIQLVALLTFSFFSCVALREAMIELPSCGCFGALKVNPWYTFGFDVLMVLGLAATSGGGRGRESGVGGGELRVGGRRWWDAKRVGWTIASLCGVALIGVGVHAAWARGKIQYVDGRELRVGSGELGAGKIVILEPSQWIGKRLPILSSVDVREQIATGEWTVVLYHADCPACRDAMPIFERQARAGKRIAAIEMPPYAPDGEELVPPSSACLRGKLSDKREWFATTPVVMSVRDATVISAREGGAVDSGRLAAGSRQWAVKR